MFFLLFQSKQREETALWTLQRQNVSHQNAKCTACSYQLLCVLYLLSFSYTVLSANLRRLDLRPEPLRVE